MPESSYDVVAIGGGPAGMAAALGAKAAGAERVLIIERDRELGGILQQCIHNGFGLRRFQEELTGPSYAHRDIATVARSGIEVWLDTLVLEADDERRLRCVSPAGGMRTVRAGSVVYAMGCRERTRGALRIPGGRPAGVYTAGAAQRMVNMEGYLPGRDIVILGSGDIGLIMARRMTLEGARVRAVFEIMPYSNGLTRNLVQCLDDFGIPLHLGHSVVAIHGESRVTGVTVAKVDADMAVIPGNAFEVPCDCVLLSVGLIPENELGRAQGVAMDPVTGGAVVDQHRRTSLAGYFAAGNVLHVHDLVDWVSTEAEAAGAAAARFARGELAGGPAARPVTAGAGLRTVVPQRLAPVAAGETVRFSFRAGRPLMASRLSLRRDGAEVWHRPLKVVKPSEMIVADLPAAVLSPAGALEFSVTAKEG